MPKPNDVGFEEYRNKVQQLAKYVVEDIDWPEQMSIRERVWNVVDEDQWIIYSGYHFPILLNSDNWNAFYDKGMETPDTDDLHEVTGPIAFQALCEDVLDYIERNYDGVR